MHIKYQRTSTDQQTGERFSMDENSYDKIFFDKGISGTKPFKERTEAAKVVELVNAGQIEKLTVPELRDIGRNTVDSINTLAWLEKHNVNVEVLSMGVTSKVDGKPNPIWKLIASVMSSLYDLELDNLKLRTKMGRDAYLRNGGKLGRKKGDTESVAKFMEKPKTKKIISLIDQGKSVRDISGRLSVSSSLVVKVRKHYLNG